MMKTTPGDRTLAGSLLTLMICQIGDQTTYSVRADDLHRVICLMAAVVVEGDMHNHTSNQPGAGKFLGELIDDMIVKLSLERQKTGVGALETVLAQVPQRLVG